MTTQELIQKLEECRSNMENSKDEMAQDTFDTLNQLIYDLENDAQYDMAQVTTNQQGVSLSATQTIQSNATVLKLDAYHISKLGAAEPNIPSIVMPYAHSATQAVDILGRYIEQYGVSGKKGFGVLFADAKNAWYLETLSGHQWVASSSRKNN